MKSSAHTPCSSHRAGHALRSEQSAPEKPCAHTHARVRLCTSHVPWPEQPAAHASCREQLAPVHPSAHLHRCVLRSHLPCPSPTEQLPGHLRDQSTPTPLQSAPKRPGWQRHTPCAQTPAFEQPLGHGSSTEQSAPPKPGPHKHSPLTQTPRPEQCAGHGATAPHASPPKPPSHTHLPSSHRPRPEHVWLRTAGHACATAHPAPE